ncbi:OmpA family protein [Marinobacteraceae bacterium S3BR75-40.1]
MKPLAPALTFLLLLALAGCAGQQPLSNEAISERYPSVWQLESAIIAARKDNLDLLAPGDFSQAQQRFERSIKLAQNDDPEASPLAQQGLQDLSRAQETAARSRDILEDVLDARQRAVEANAHKILANRFSENDKTLKNLSRAIEQGNTTAARTGRRALEEDYRSLELLALQREVVDQAEEVISRAEENDVEDLAPKTMKTAREELRLARDVLAADRSDIERAKSHAARATAAAQRATQIADLITQFEQADFEPEDTVLWYQGQLAEVVSPLDQKPTFTRPYKRTVEQLQSEVRMLVNRNQLLEASLAEKEDQIMALQQSKEAQLSKVMAESSSERMKREETAARFAFVQNLFDPQDAEVYRRGDDVLIRAQGFQFPSGQSELQSANFPLLNKITEAVKKFPDALVVVSGHTDNVGSVAKNRQLSEERAEKVSRFLSDVGGVNPKRITTVGHGAEQPVASNDTPEGRAANRRVEVLLVNEGPMKATAAGKEESAAGD